MPDIAGRQADQDDVIRFLESGAGRGPRAQRIDTHGAMIFLIGQQALKIKRAVKYDYMDLSTVDKRHAMLVREFELNRSAAPSIYRGVIPVVRRPGGALAFGGTGEVLEWVLFMHRFARDDELPQIAQARGIDDDLAQRLGQSIARYHARAPVRDLDGAQLIGEILDELDRVLGTMEPVFQGAVGQFDVRARKEFRDRAADMAGRSQHGHIRRCHGDLHLRNIVMIDGVPTPFDALEFDERLGTCDTLYDLAFLLMDLDHLGMRHAANLVLNAYLAEAPAELSDAGLSLLPLYLSIRAAIRAMVDVQTAGVSGNRDARADEPGRDMLQDARAYLEQALNYLDPAAPVLVAIGGFSGAGKTTIARAIAHRIGAAPGAVHIRSDTTRKRLMKQDPLERLGAEGYAPQVTARTYAAIRAQARQVLDQGHAAILDAVHGDLPARRAAEDVARAADCGFVGFWLDTPTRTRLTRVAARAPDASDADASVVKRQAVVDPGQIDWRRIDTDQPLDAVIDAMSAILRSAAAADARADGGTHVG